MAQVDIESPRSLGFVRLTEAPIIADKSTDKFIEYMLHTFKAEPNEYWLRSVEGQYEVVYQQAAIGAGSIEAVETLVQLMKTLNAVFAFGEISINRKSWKLVTIVRLS